MSSGYRLLRWDGVVASEGEMRRIEPTSPGFVSRLLAIGLGEVEPGEYLLELTILDELADRSQVLREPITIIPPKRSAQPATPGDAPPGGTAR